MELNTLIKSIAFIVLLSAQLFCAVPAAGSAGMSENDHVLDTLSYFSPYEIEWLSVFDFKELVGEETDQKRMQRFVNRSGFEDPELLEKLCGLGVSNYVANYRIHSSTVQQDPEGEKEGGALGYVLDETGTSLVPIRVEFHHLLMFDSEYLIYEAEGLGLITPSKKYSNYYESVGEKKYYFYAHYGKVCISMDPDLIKYALQHVARNVHMWTNLERLEELEAIFDKVPVRASYRIGFPGTRNQKVLRIIESKSQDLGDIQQSMRVALPYMTFTSIVKEGSGFRENIITVFNDLDGAKKNYNYNMKFKNAGLPVELSISGLTSTMTSYVSKEQLVVGSAANLKRSTFSRGLGFGPISKEEHKKRSDAYAKQLKEKGSRK